MYARIVVPRYHCRAGTVATSNPLQRGAQSDRCPRCLGVEIDHSPTETWCRDCGFVLDDTPVDHGPDWRSFGGTRNNDTDPERAAPGNRNHPDRGLGAGYDPQQTDRDDGRRATIDKHARLGDKVSRNRAYATGEVHRMQGALDLPKYVGQRGKHLFRRLHADGLNGADLDTVAAAVLLAACREQGMGRTAGDIAAVARCEGSALRRRFMRVQRDLGLELPPPNVRQRVRVVAARLSPDPAAVDRALTRLEGLDGGDTAGTSPSVLAATLLYEAGEWTQAEVCEVAGCTPPAIRECSVL